MTPNSLSPAYAVINYHSEFGSHKMTIPTTNYNPGAPVGTFDIPGGGIINASDMINDLVDAIVAFFPDTVAFDFFEIFTKATATADSVLRLSQTMAQVGASATPGWTKAAEAVWSFKTLGNGLFKLVFLDFDSGDQWDKITFSGLTGPALTLVNYLNGGGHGWTGRDDTSPGTFLQIAYGLNKALRRKYNMN